jgi:hypothetical protein
LIYALSENNPQLRLSLINGDILPEKIIFMDEKDLGNDAFKKRLQE